MGKVQCQYHQEKGIKPVMIPFGTNSLGTTEYICAVCSRIRHFGVGEVLSYKQGYGFIKGSRQNFFFHHSNLAYPCQPTTGMQVSFELLFMENDRVQAVHVKPYNGQIGGGNNERKDA